MLIFQKECRIIRLHRGLSIPISIDTLKTVFQNKVSQTLHETKLPGKLVSP